MWLTITITASVLITPCISTIYNLFTMLLRPLINITMSRFCQWFICWIFWISDQIRIFWTQFWALPWLHVFFFILFIFFIFFLLVVSCILTTACFYYNCCQTNDKAKVSTTTVNFTILWSLNTRKCSAFKEFWSPQSPHMLLEYVHHLLDLCEEHRAHVCCVYICFRLCITQIKATNVRSRHSWNLSFVMGILDLLFFYPYMLIFFLIRIDGAPETYSTAFEMLSGMIKVFSTYFFQDNARFSTTLCLALPLTDSSR